MWLVTLGQSFLVRWFTQFYFWYIPQLFALINRLWPSKTSLPPISDELLLQSATALGKSIRSGKISSEAVVQAYIHRIEATNAILNAVVETNFVEALEEARALDLRIAQNDIDSLPSEEDAPFLGVPFTLKDAITVQGKQCTAGIAYRKDLKMERDAEVVTLMRRSGAILLGLTNVSEVCMWWETANTVYGRTHNPYDQRRMVGGSSGGEACTVGSACSVIGLGSDIGGSIRMPSFFNGVFGHKPTPGIASIDGLIPTVDQSNYRGFMLTSGPICRYAEDLSPMVRILAGDNVKKLKLFQKVDFTSMRIFYMEEIHSAVVSPISEEMKAAVRQVVNHFETVYGCLAIRVNLPLVHWAIPFWLTDMAGQKGEFASFAREMADGKCELNVVAEVGKWLTGKSVHTWPALSLALFEKLSGNLGSDAERLTAVRFREKLQRQFEGLLGGSDNNAIFLFPSHPSVAPFHNQPIFTPFNYAYTALFNSVGLPVTQCPLGLNRDGMPLGLQVAAAPFNDHLSLAVAKELERTFGGWKSPS